MKQQLDLASQELMVKFLKLVVKIHKLIFLDANGHIQRGCGSELRNETCDSELCQTCQLTGIGSAACNLDLFPQHRLSCYICDGDRNSSCANLDAANSTLHAQPCPIFRLEDSCFSTRAAGTVSRGCASSIPRGRCDHGVCGFCRGPNCNSGQFDSLNNALNIKIGFKLIAFVFAILAFNF